MPDFAPFFLTLKLATATTIVLFVVGVPIAWWLAFSTTRLKVVLEALVGLPLILPPSVLGFYLLLAFSPENGLGKFLATHFDLRIVFSFTGLVLASVLYSLPFMIQPIQSGFRMVPASLLEVSYTLGKSKFTTLMKVLLPNSRNALITGCILSFAHTIGEFGVVLMVGGNIPRETRVISIALYDEVEAMNYHHANIYAMILLGFSFVVLLTVHLLNNRVLKTLY